jgi:hypothetical protein
MLEEVVRDSRDLKLPVFIALSDAKSAFDVVNKQILMRKAFLAGVASAPWTLIDQLHSETRAVVKLLNQQSLEYDIQQGVKQGGLLSADLYKLYIEDLLHTFETARVGCKIGPIHVNATACADDVALLSHNPQDLQLLINYAQEYSKLHRYQLQPQKSVVIPVMWSSKCKQKQKFKWKLD